MREEAILVSEFHVITNCILFSWLLVQLDNKSNYYLGLKLLFCFLLVETQVNNHIGLVN